MVGHEGLWATLAGLVPICPRGHFSDLTPKYLTLVATTPGCGQALGRALPPCRGPWCVRSEVWPMAWAPQYLGAGVLWTESILIAKENQK